MASQTAICNRALEFLGQGPVTSIDSSQPAAKALRRVFDDTRRALLEDHPWNFAKKRASIAASATVPDWGFTNGYPVPVDYVRLLAIENEPEFSIEADPSGSLWILTNATAPLAILYIYDVTDTGRYPPSFVDALASRLALDTCEDITQSNAKKQYAAEIHASFLLKAKSINGLQRQAVTFKEFSFSQSRRVGASAFWPPLSGTGEPR
jgi:hypothetical protein